MQNRALHLQKISCFLWVVNAAIQSRAKSATKGERAVRRAHKECSRKSKTRTQAKAEIRPVSPSESTASTALTGAFGAGSSGVAKEVRAADPLAKPEVQYATGVNTEHLTSV